jgi:hypothetical protein
MNLLQRLGVQIFLWVVAWAITMLAWGVLSGLVYLIGG